MFDAEGNFLIHGREWGQHKYIRKEGNRYIYPEDLKSGGGMPSNVGGQQRQNTSGSDYARRQQAQGSVAASRAKFRESFARARQENDNRNYNQQLQNPNSSAADYARRQRQEGLDKNYVERAKKALISTGYFKDKNAGRPNADVTGQQAARRAANQGIASQKRINETKQYQEGLKTSGKGIAEMEARRGKRNESRAKSIREGDARNTANQYQQGLKTSGKSTADAESRRGKSNKETDWKTKQLQKERTNNTTSGSDYARRQKEAGEKNAKDIKRKIGYGTQAAKSKAEKAYNVGKNTTERILTRLKTTDIPNAKKNYNKATDAAAEGLLKATNAHKKFTDNAADALLGIEKKFKKKKR